MGEKKPENVKNRLYWFTVENRAHGPVSGHELKQLARTKVLSPDASIWEDGSSEIFVARNIPRLFDEQPSDAKQPPAASPVDQSQSGADHSYSHYPVIRVERNWYSTRLMAVYTDHVLYGKRFWGELTLTESSCMEDGEEELSRKLSHPVRISNRNIVSICGWRRSKTLATLMVRDSWQKAFINLPIIDCKQTILALETGTNAHYRASDSGRDQNCSVLLIYKSMVYPWMLFLALMAILMSTRNSDLTNSAIAFAFLVISIPGEIFAALRLRNAFQLTKWSYFDSILASFLSLKLLVPPVLLTIAFASEMSEGNHFVLLGLLFLLWTFFSAVWHIPELHYLDRVLTSEPSSSVDVIAFLKLITAEESKPNRAKSFFTMPLGTVLISLFNRKRSQSSAAGPQRPRHSFVIGTALKLIGVAYFIAISSPLMRPLDELSPWSDREIKIKDVKAWQQLWFLLYAPAPALLYLGYRLSLRPWDGCSTDDSRRPILFLRPFSDDASTTLQPSGILAGLCGIDRTPFSLANSQWFSRSVYNARTGFSDLCMSCHPVRLLRMLLNKAVDTSEESLAAFFRSYGPVRAIGRPAEFAPMPGAERLYVGDDWKLHVESMLRASQMIVIQPGLSEGVAWELTQIRAQCQPFRILFCLVGFMRSPGSYDELRKVIWKSMAIELPRSVPFANRPCFVSFDQSWQPTLHVLSYRNPLHWPFLGDAVDLRYTLDPFLQGAHGGDREPPREPKWNKTLHFLPTSIVAGTIGLSLLIIPGILIESSSHYVTEMSRSLTEAMGFHESNRRTYSGTAIPYSVEIPETWIRVEGQRAPVEYQFRKSGVGTVRIIASSEYEDVSNLGDVLLAAEKSQDVQGVFRSAEVESSTHRIVSERQCAECVLQFELKSGERMNSHVIAHSGSEGMMLINVSYGRSISKRQILECESILNSLKLNFKPSLEPKIDFSKSSDFSKRINNEGQPE